MNHLMEMLYGSSLAMYHALKQIGKDVDIFIPEYPRSFDFLPGADKVKELRHK